MKHYEKPILTLAIAMALAAQPALAAKGGSPGKPVDGEEGAGNNLSTPVIWSDGVTKDLRIYNNDPTDALFTGLTYPCTDIPGETCYQQQQADNIWQAESWNALENATSYGNTTTAIDYGLQVDEIDWGDNLEARDWNDNSVVRVETVLWQVLGGGGNHTLPTMTAYEMSYLFGQGPSEIWGTTSYVYDSLEATVYSNCARLVIQKVAEPDEAVPSLEWDAVNSQWGTAPTYFNGAVWEGGDGPGFYSSEVNVSGKVIYGFNWDVKQMGDGAGVYRLTFSLDGTREGGQQCDGTTLNTWLDFASIRESEEGEELEPTEVETGGGTAVVDAFNNLTYIDVTIQSRSGGGGTGGGGGGGGQGGGNGQGGGGPRR